MSDSLINSVPSVVTQGHVGCNFLIFHFSNTANANMKRSHLLCGINFLASLSKNYFLQKIFHLLEAKLVGKETFLF